MKILHKNACRFVISVFVKYTIKDLLFVMNADVFQIQKFEYKMKNVIIINGNDYD